MNNQSQAPSTPCPRPTPDPEEQLLSVRCRSYYNRMRKEGPYLAFINKELVDVTFQIDVLEGGGQTQNRVGCTLLWGHKFVLMDGPFAKFFKKSLLGHPHPKVVVKLPDSIKPAALNQLLNYVYGVELGALGLQQGDVDDFLEVAAFFEMDIYLLGKLVLHCSPLDLNGYVSKKFESLILSPQIWTLDDDVFMKLFEEDPEGYHQRLLEIVGADEADNEAGGEQITDPHRGVRKSVRARKPVVRLSYS